VLEITDLGSEIKSNTENLSNICRKEKVIISRVGYGKINSRTTQVGADPASPGEYAARVAQLDMCVGMLDE